MKTKYFIGLDVHKEKTTYVVKDRIGNILMEGEAATLYPELHGRLKPYLRLSMTGLEASTSYYALYQEFVNYSGLKPEAYHAGLAKSMSVV